jgi:hypothetical protein
VRSIDPAGVLKLKGLVRQGAEVLSASLLVSAFSRPVMKDISPR